MTWEPPVIALPEPGYYWVKWGGALVIALWERVGEAGWWVITGVGLPRPVEDVEVVSERLRPPELAP